MKYFITFILLLASSVCFYILACGPMYPDEVRFSILQASSFQNKDFDPFHYSKHLFQYPYSYEEDVKELRTTTLPDENIQLWSKYCNNQVTTGEIEEAIYKLDKDSVQVAFSQNGMLQYLKKTKKDAVIDYIIFAKNCEFLNQFHSDPWERKSNNTDKQVLSQRHLLIEYALNKTTQADNEIRLRYAFLSIRLAFYNNDGALIKKIYQQFFASRQQKNVIDYWALYFYTVTQPEGASKNFNVAKVYAHAPDKRMAVIYDYKKTVPISNILALAQNKNDTCDVYLTDAVRNPGRALPNLKNMFLLGAQSEFLDFLLLREINKLEDWLYTPAYYLFPPSLSFDPYYGQAPYQAVLKNIEKDRLYAREVLAFVDTVRFAGTKNKALWSTAKAYLHLMLKEYDQSLAITSAVKKQVGKPSNALYNIQMIEALALAARQEKGVAVIPEAIKPLLLSSFQKKNYAFIFAIAKELEIKGNTSDAALLMTKVNQGEAWESENIYWKNARGINNQYVDFYWEHFGYLDAQYTASQLNTLINNILKSKPDKDPFTEWKYSSIKKEIPRLYDLLGTKYIRENNLEAALRAFKNVNDTLWTSQYHPFNFYLAANPFYTNMYNEHRVTPADTIRYNKTTITSTLIDHLKKAADTSRSDRDYHCFLAANCYLNMTQYGNSWMMRRYYWTSSKDTTGIIDDNEYFNCTLARKYYLEAKKRAKNKKFSALCLRMAGRCEKYRLSRLYESINDYNRYQEKLFQQNRYYKDLKKQYPQHYDELMSNCESFESYFAARGKK